MNKVKFVKLSESIKRGEGTSYKILNFITGEDSLNVSLAVSQLDGETPKTKNVESDRVYFFLEGRATFVFEGGHVRIEKNSALYIPKNTSYKMKGSFKAVLVNAPSFDLRNERQSE